MKSKELVNMRRQIFVAVLLACLFFSIPAISQEWSNGCEIVSFSERDDLSMQSVAGWEGLLERHWAGPTIWANRLQDWVVHDGLLECVPADIMPCRTAHILTYDLGDKNEPFQMEAAVKMGTPSEKAGSDHPQ